MAICVLFYGRYSVRDKIYLPFLEEKRASTKKGYEEIRKNHIRDRVGNVQLRNSRTVNANRMLRAIADKNLSAIFTHAKDEGAFDSMTSCISFKKS